MKNHLCRNELVMMKNFLCWTKLVAMKTLSSEISNNEDSILDVTGDNEDSELSWIRDDDTLIQEEGSGVGRVGSTTSVSQSISHFSSSSSTKIPTGAHNTAGSHTWSNVAAGFISV